MRKKRIPSASAFLHAVIICFIIFSWVIVSGAESAEYRIQPSILVSEEYNDNVYLTPQNRIYDYITRVIPSVNFSYKAPLWDWNVAYAYDYYYFARIYPSHTDTHTANLTGLTRIVKDFFFLALSDTYKRTSLDVTRDFTKQSLFVNQTDQNIGSINPYFVVPFGARTTANVGYIYRNIWYKDPNAFKKADHIGYVEMVHEITSKLSTTVGLRYDDATVYPHIQDTTQIQDYRRSDATVGMKYEYTEGSSLYGTIGNSWFDFEAAGKESQVFWSAGFNHKFPKFSFSFETGLSYIEDPLLIIRREDRYVATISRAVERTTYSVLGGLLEYRDARTKHLQQTSYTLGGTFSHALSTKSKILIDLSYQRLEDNVFNTYTGIYLSGGRYEYQMLESLLLALEYRYTNSYSPDIFGNKYTNNRLIAELKKTF